MSKKYPRYMWATKAIHLLGDISREDGDLCVVQKESGENYIGNWVTGYGFVEVKFPKETTRELTTEEIEKYDGMQLAIGNCLINTINMSKEKGEL